MVVRIIALSHQSLPAMCWERRFARSEDCPTYTIHIQYLQGSYGSVDLGATMALIVLSLIPIVIFYLSCQKHIIKRVAAGAVKG